MAAIEGNAAPQGLPLARGRASANLALVALAFVLPPIGYLHMVGNGAVSPFRQTISDYVVVPHGTAVLALGVASAIVAGAALSRSIAALPGVGPVQVLLLIWCLALAVGAVFPTNVPGTPADFSAAMHRYSGATHFAVLPIAGLLLARFVRDVPEWRAAAAWVRRASLVTGMLSIMFFLGHIPIVFFNSPEVVPLGLIERVLFGVEIALLAVIAFAARRAAGIRGAAR